MRSTELKGHSETLASLLVKPVMCVSQEWKKLQADINDLCLINYSNYLDAQASKVNENHKKCEPVRSMGDSCVVYEACKVENQNLKDAYVLLDKSVRASAGQPVFFDENLHVKTGFRSNVERFRFYENVHLTMPVLILKYAPGGSHFTTVCFLEIEEGHSELQKQTDCARFFASVMPKLPVFHTREMKNNFKQKIKNLVSIQLSVVDFICKELCWDASAASNPETQQRLQ